MVKKAEEKQTSNSGGKSVTWLFGGAGKSLHVPDSDSKYCRIHTVDGGILDSFAHLLKRHDR